MVHLLGGLAAGFAIIVLVAAWRLSSGPVSLAFLSPYIEDALNADRQAFRIRLDDTILTWAGWERTLDIRALNVRAIGPDGRLIASAPELSLSLSTRALMRGMLAPASIDVFRPKLRLLRHRDGRFQIGFDIDQSASDAVFNRVLLGLLSPPDPDHTVGYLSRFTIVDADLTIEDRRLDTSWKAPATGVTLRRDAAGIRGEAALALDVDGQKAQVAASDIRVTLAGVDATPEMLEVANSRIGSLADLRHGRAESLPFEDESFDTTVSTNALHFFRLPETALREMWRVIKPGGRVVVTDWCDDFVACRICDRALRVFSPAHHRVYGTRGCWKLLQDAGFQSIDIERYKITWLWGLMTATASKTKSGRPAFPSRRSVVSPCDCPTPRPSRGKTRRNLRLTDLLRPVRETVNTGGGVFRRPLGRHRTPNKTSKFARRRPIYGTPFRNASRPCGL